jgi:single-stranded DNA-binding protein
MVTGRLTTNSWEDKNGTKRTNIEILAKEVMAFNSANPTDASK